MASSKKTGPAKSKTAKNKPDEAKIDDAQTPEPKADTETTTDANLDTTQEPQPETSTGPKMSEPAGAIADPPADAPESADESPPEPEKEPEPSETEPEAEPEPAQTALVTASPPPEKKSVFLPLVLGGVVAGALGFMASEYQMFGNADAVVTTELRGDLDSQQERIAALEQAESPAADVDLTPLQDEMAGIETHIATLEDRVGALEERPVIAAPEGVDPDAAAAYAAELEALRADAQTQRAEIEALINNARTVEEATADAARSARGQAAIANIVSAIDAGQPFSEAVETLRELDLGELDPALTGPAENGLTTLSVLQAEFPDLAREALAAARAAGSEGEGQQGIGGFLTRSLGVRSVAPREGSDPDAVLSRAEAAVNTGDLAEALTELDTLPEEAQAVMADWRAAADARVSARAAADALAQRLTAD